MERTKRGERMEKMIKCLDDCKGLMFGENSTTSIVSILRSNQGHFISPKIGRQFKLAKSL